MDAGATDDQRLVLETSARLMDQVCPLARVRAYAYGDPEFALDYRRRGADLGWFSMLVPEEAGGGSISGNGVLDAALISYERGRRLQPAPFVASNVVAFALARAGRPDQWSQVLAPLLTGDASAAWVPPGSGHGEGLRAERTGTGFVISGKVSQVQDADTATWLMLTADTDDGPLQVLVETGTSGITIERLDALDISRSFCEVNADGLELTAAALVGEGPAPDLVDKELALACVLTAAESVGSMDHDFSLAVQYAKDRIAFGRPIGSFQAVKHLLADTSLMLEMSKAITLAAAEELGREGGYALEAATMAKAFVGDCGIELAQNCFQVFGGIGFTWEHDQHLYLRRLTMDAALFGDPAWHRERLCRISGL